MAGSFLVSAPRQLLAVLEHLDTLDVIAVDAEANGLHAYRPKLCVLQLAWRAGESVDVAIVDVLAIDPRPLSRVLGPDGPVKVLHDLTFDARLLHEAGIELGNVRDTSVAARFLGEQATGLKALCNRRLGVTLEKHLQAHDWAARPFTPMQLEYLAGDVRHLFALDETLEADADKQGILPEVADECRYRLTCALRGPKQRAAPWTRVDGYDRLEDAQRAVLVELWAVRDGLAAEQDVPPFRVAANALLCMLARRKPSTESDLRRAGGGRVMRHARAWLAAVARGLQIGAPPVPSVPEEPRPPPDEFARKKRLHGALLRWRKDESKRRRVDAQVVLPGHCTDALLDALARYGNDFAALLAALGAIEGLGEMRTRRYLGVWWGLAVAAFSYLPLVSSDEPLPQ